jgi:glutathione synthase/RimK-type ligase-like ATP-grasp enzyme
MESRIQNHDIGLVWNWEYDRDFLQLIFSAAQARELSTFLIDQQNLADTFERLKDDSLCFGFILDRASDEDERFLPLAHLLGRRGLTSTHRPPLRVINSYDLLRRASDKATMHLEFLSRGLHVPFTIIISPFNHKREVELSLTELAQLGRPFIIKPANTTGGGVGVVLGAESLKDIIETRQHHKNDKYLLQEKVVPAYLTQRRAWFRVFYAFGLILPCWWDDQTHIYEEITTEEEARFNLQPLRSIASTIREICGLDFFSTEVAFTPAQAFIVVDYVNEMCDMRLKSRYDDGVPDRVVQAIAEELVAFVAIAKTRNQ